MNAGPAGQGVVPAVEADDTQYVDDALYDDVLEFFRRNHMRDDWAEETPTAVADRVLSREARLLDGGRYEDWLAMFVPHCVYWVPSRVLVGDPRLEPSIHFDDHRRLADRIALIRTGFQHAQTPASRTTRSVSNVEAWQMGSDGIDVQSCVQIQEYRRDRHQSFVGRQLHRLESVGSDWRIQYRIVMLLDRDADQGNLTFIL